MERPLVVWITSGFPYGSGEQFIETEVQYWSGFPGDVILLPENPGPSEARPVPEGVRVSTRLMHRWNSLRWQLLAALQAVVSPVLWRELGGLVASRRVSRYRVQHAVLSVVRVKMEERVLRILAHEHGRPIDVVYAYWMSIASFAGCIGRRKGYVRRVVARAHGTDLYEDKRPERYTALVRQFAREYEALFTISEDGRAHAERYGFAPEQLRVARLGVTSAGRTLPSDPGHLSLLSVSSLTPFKQVHLIVAAVAEVAKRLPETQVHWTHVGTGELGLDIERAVAERLGLANVTVDLLGHIPNPELMTWFDANRVDLFLNASSSEGVPVSIMEAMAHEVPVIAPDVGAVSEIVPPELLLPADLTVDDLATRVIEVRERVKDPAYRQAIRALQVEAYDADTNYSVFVRDMAALGADDA